MIIPTQNKHLAEDYYNKLPAGDINRRYYEEGLTHDKVDGVWARLRAAADIPNKLKTLNGFYPYQRIIRATEQQYYEYSEVNFLNLLEIGTTNLRQMPFSLLLPG